jgi:hypothetical protein
VLVEAAAGDGVAAEDVGEDAREHPQPVPGLGHDRVVDEVRRAAVLDLLDEVPQEERRHAGVAVVEEAVAVAQPHVEQRRESGFDVRGVGEVELERLGLEESLWPRPAATHRVSSPIPSGMPIPNACRLTYGTEPSHGPKLGSSVFHTHHRSCGPTMS